MKLSAKSDGGCTGSDGPAVESEMVLGGVVERSVAGGVVPETGVPLEFVSPFSVEGSAECWRLSC